MIFANVIAAGIRLATPLAYSAIGETVSENAGVVNLQLEGMMLCGAFTGVLGAHLTGSPYRGLAFALIGGLGVAALHAFISVTLGANQIVSGIALNLVAIGGTTYLLDAYFHGQLSAQVLPVLPITGLSSIPALGGALFDQNIGVYGCYVLLPLASLALRRTTWGLGVVACGENPHAADAHGVRVHFIRYQAVLVAGLLAGIGGGVFALAELGSFQPNMIQGRGYIALATVLFGNWRLTLAVGGAVLFGLADALRLELQSFGVGLPPEVMDMFPYLITLLVLAVVTMRSRAPRYLTVPYFRGLH